MGEGSEAEKEPFERLAQLGGEIRDAYARHKRVMSFDEYYALVADAPQRHARSAPQYLLDALEYFGTEEIHHPRGTVTRWKLFDAPWEGGKDRLVGQEEVQARIVRALQ